METKLISKIETKPLTKILIVGNGAVDGGNEPLRNAIADCEEYERYAGIDTKYKNSNPDLATYLGAVAYVARDNRYAVLRLLAEKGQLDESERSWFTFHAEFVVKFRNTIGQRFSKAREDRKIKLRDTSYIFRYLNLKDDEPFGVISLNWDELLFENKKLSEHLVALHGRASIPQSLILPMEATTDDVILDLFLKSHPMVPESPDMQLIQKAFREKKVRDEHDYIHHVASRWLQNAKQIVMWGVALNPYDAEFISLIPKDDRERSLVVINPDARARDVTGTLLTGRPRNRIDFDPIRGEEIIKKF